MVVIKGDSPWSGLDPIENPQPMFHPAAKPPTEGRGRSFSKGSIGLVIFCVEIVRSQRILIIMSLAISLARKRSTSGDVLQVTRTCNGNLEILSQEIFRGVHWSHLPSPIQVPFRVSKETQSLTDIVTNC